MKKVLATLFGAGLVLAAVAAEINVAADNWELPKGWQLEAGKIKLTGSTVSTSLIAMLKDKTVAAAPAEFSAAVKITGQTPNEKAWRTVGLVLGPDSKNYFQLALIEPPPSGNEKRFVELKQMKDGKWGSGAGLPKSEYRQYFRWENDQTYTLKLTVGSREIAGVVTDEAGKDVVTLTIPVSDAAQAVSTGIPMLRASGIVGEIGNLKMETK